MHLLCSKEINIVFLQDIQFKLFHYSFMYFHGTRHLINESWCANVSTTVVISGLYCVSDKYLIIIYLRMLLKSYNQVV